ncbi:MAG TPA: hypothetical protein VFG50_12500 [Rhodothermales bacterium]|nr:hypothetical protein [Rhodothermales bacterium]
MDTLYPDIPTAGVHRGALDHVEEITTSVRAARINPEKAERKPVEKTYVHLRSDTEGWERVRAYDSDHLPQPVGGTTEQGRFTSTDEVGRLLTKFRDQNQRYVVFENTETGDVFYQNETDVHGDWTGNGRFDQITVFNDQGEAAAYAERRRSKKKRNG